jgi:ANTAR domain
MRHAPSDQGDFMGDATRQHFTDTTAEETNTSLSVVMQAANSIASSAEPDVVFESLVQVCAPLVCDAATATVSGPDGRIYATTWPNGALNHRAQPDSVVTDFVAPACGDYAGYHGLVSLRFGHQVENGPLIAQLLVERALANVERERLVEAVATRKATANHLELALASNREIGVAVGILMVNHELTDEQALDLLSRVSQHSNRKLRAIALEVARTGVIELPAGVAIVERDSRRRRLVSVPTPGRG